MLPSLSYSASLATDFTLIINYYYFFMLMQVFWNRVNGEWGLRSSGNTIYTTKSFFTCALECYLQHFQVLNPNLFFHKKKLLLFT